MGKKQLFIKTILEEGTADPEIISLLLSRLISSPRNLNIAAKLKVMFGESMDVLSHESRNDASARGN